MRHLQQRPKPEPTPYEKATGIGANPLLRTVNPPEAIRDTWC